MPNWQPNWNDVRWDHAASDEAIAALRHAADQLDYSADERTRLAADAQREWRGPYRERFDRELADILHRTRSLAEDLRAKANEIARAAHRAYEEQQHRLRERERWRREKAEEEERERRRC